MSESLWTSEEIMAAVGGELHGKPFQVSGVTFDSREVGPGDLFVALAGVRDGHDFASGAFERGAAGALTSKCVPGSHVQVSDTLKALEDLAAAARDRSFARRCAVTGSVGKTSVTQAVKAGLELAGRAHGSVKSYNNHIGVPLTLARMPRDTERAVFEIGMNHAGEIEPLVKMVRPQAVAITTVGPVHTENFADGEQGVARAKAEIFAGLEPGGVAILNADDQWFGFLKGEAEKVGAKVLSFGSKPDCDAQLLDFRLAPSGPSDLLPQGGRKGAGELSSPLRGGGARSASEGAIVTARLHGRDVTIPLAQTGAHWGPNSLCTLLLLEQMDVPLETGLAALAAFAPLSGRGEVKTINGPRGAFILIDESYNANPISMRATIASLGVRPAAGRRIAILTDMLELGVDAERQHAALAGALDESGIDLVFVAGPLMASLWEALPPKRRGAKADSAAELAHSVVDAVREGDVVMVKGSNGSKASVIAAALARGEAA
ncbi:MAG: UDP-N-acetylmuramoyl-tripeptide--D-alanyl-D-alanine ligase [Caulobacteraceae bacterium]